MVYCNGRFVSPACAETIRRPFLRAPNPADALPYNAPDDSDDHDPAFYESSDGHDRYVLSMV